MFSRFKLRRFRVPAYWPWVVGGLLVIAVAWWLIPRRTTEVVSVDGNYRWVHYEAPPQRQVLWTPALRVDDLPLAAGPRDSFIRPALAEGGARLYFTVRESGGDLDIYQSRLVDERWQAAEPVAELNTKFNDIGPVIRADGRELYLYSNRPGGYGGYDIYISRRGENGWSEPENAGPLVNSPANEYDPAAAPHGRQLYYASDRSRAMQAWVAAGKQVEAADEWRTTLRAQRGLIQFDLYQASRDDETSPWRVGRPLHALNHPTANEGAPFVDPWGAFVYFVSDRPQRDGEPPNYDIYRARIEGELIGAAENLGRGVNTADHEVEPALSPEGYRLLFSRNLPEQGSASPQDELYALYGSTATEVYAARSWDDNNWRSLMAFLAMWWLELLLLALVLLLAALVYWLVHQKWVRRMSVPTFLLLALLFHVMFGAGSFFVYLGGDIVERIQEYYVAPDMVADNLDTSEQAEPEAFEEVADLQAVESVDVASTPRQVTETQHMPVEVENYQPTIPAQLARELPPEQVIALPPKLAAPAPAQPELARRELIKPSDMIAPSELATEQPRPQDVPAREPQEVASAAVPIERAAAAPEEQAVPDQLIRRTLTPQAAAVNDAESYLQPAAEPVATPESTAVAAAPAMQRRSTAQASAAEASQVDMLKVVPAEGDAAEQAVEVGAAEVDLARAEEASSPLQVEQVKARLASTAAITPSAVGTEALRANPSASDLTDVRFTADVANPLAGRQTRLPAEFAEASVEKQQLMASRGAPAASDSASDGPATAEVALARRETAGQPQIGTSAQLANSAKTAASRPQLAESDLAAVTSSSIEAPASSLAAAQPSLSRRTAAAAAADFAETATAIEQLAASSNTSGGTMSPAAQAGLAVGLERNDTAPVSLTASPVKELSGPRRSARHDLTLGRIGPVENNAPPTFGPVAGQLARRSAVASPLMFAEENVGLAAMFRLRMSEAKETLLEEFGGSQATEEAVRRGLLWISTHQNADGSWSLNRFDQRCKDHDKCNGHGGVQSDTAATAFALLPFLGAGHTHNEASYQNTVRAGIDWLLKNQKGDGDLSQGSGGNSQMYAHGIASIALCEAYGMSKDQRLADPARRAIEFIVNAQDERSGGWRYHPRQQGDTSVVGWQVMALKSGQMAGIEVPEQTLELARKFIESVEGKGNRQGWFGYQSPNDRNDDPAMTAEAMLCSQYLGARRGNESLHKGADHLLQRLPQKGKSSSYYWYYGTQCMYHMQGEHWREWNQRMSTMLVDTQRRDGPMAGTWDPDDNWERQGGRIMSTSLRLLILEVYYRHLPLYQVLE